MNPSDAMPLNCMVPTEYELVKVNNEKHRTKSETQPKLIKE